MTSSFFSYLQQLELMAFFSGYPLVYLIVFFLAGDRMIKNDSGTRVVSLLPFAYALMGTLYLGLQLKVLYPDYSFENIELTVQHPYLMIWGLFPILCWITTFRKKPYLSLLHSLIFFLFLVKDLFFHFFRWSADGNIIKNDMKVYTISILFNLLTFTLIALLFLLFARCKTWLKSKSGQ